MKEIPISFRVKGNKVELSRDLFGLGEKVTDPEYVKYMGTDGRFVNSEAEITDGVIIKEVKGKGKIKVEEAYVPFGEILAIISIIGSGITLTELSYKITNWLIDKTHNFNDIEIKLNGKIVNDKEEIKKLLEEILKDDEE